MSRIGKQPVSIPAGVDVAIDGQSVKVKGPKGELTHTFLDEVTIRQDGDTLLVERLDDERIARSVHGLSRTLLSNMLVGVTEQFTKTLELNGVGYRAAKSGKTLTLTVGKSHPETFEENDDIKIEVPNPNLILVTGPDKQKVGAFAANLRATRPAEPYKGKGLKYEGERIKRKVGKAGKK